MTPIIKKGDKQLVRISMPITLLPICGKIFEKIILTHLYSYLTGNNLITKGFRPGDSTVNQLLYLFIQLHEVRAVFLDISKAFDKVCHDGLIFKLKQNGISCYCLKPFCTLATFGVFEVVKIFFSF